MIKINYNPQRITWNKSSKRFIRCLTIIVTLVVNVSIVQAQTIIDVCGNDTVILTAGNYQHSPIQWQSSYNLTDWTNISNAQETTYTFLPTETKYYRAQVTYAECPPEYSEISLVQMPPVASAGADRTLPGSSASLTGNEEAGSTGAWSVLSGSGGIFSDMTDPLSQFYGSDTAYALVYSLQNTCGTDSDTAEIRFLQNSYVSNIVVVDSTDLFLSDTNQVSQGEYRIYFSNPIPVITDSTYLVGIVNDGFLRQVTSFTVEADTFTMQTEQATLEDIIVDGALDLAQTFSVDTTTGKTSYGPQPLDHMPTRNELLNDPKFQTDEVFFYYPEEKVQYIHEGVTLSNKMKSSTSYLIDINFNNSIYNSGGLSLHLNGHYKFEPNIVADMEFKFLNLKTAKIGMYNGVIDQNYQLSLTATSTTTLVNQPFTLLSMNKPVIIVVGGIPVVINTTLKLNGKVSADLTAAMNITHEYSKVSTHTASLEYANQEWGYNYSESSQVNVDNSFSATGTLSQDFTLGPELSFKVYNIVGPYAEAKLTEELSLCTDQNANWAADMNIDGYIKVGAKAEVASVTIFDESKTWAQNFYSLEFPHEIDIESGNNQSYTLGNQLAYPVEVKITSNKGAAIPFVTVHFNPLNAGSVANSTVVTDVNGIASTTWTPGGTVQSQLEVNVLDCDGNPIGNAPVLFEASESVQGANCLTSSLSASINQNGNIISPLAHLGAPPYAYSTDGVNFNATIPQATTTLGQTYTFYVKDANNCIASVSYNASTSACINSSISLDVEVSGANITATGQGGVPPYQYALDAGSYSFNNIFSNVSLGAHDVYVQDANGCIASVNVTVTFGANASGCGGLTTINDVDGYVYDVVEINGVCWMQENLKTSYYSNGDPIVNLVDNSDWSNASYGAWSWYDNSSQNDLPYGKLYNWFAVDDARNICPDNWHVSTSAEWDALLVFIDPNTDVLCTNCVQSTIASYALRETGTAHWSGNNGATNSSGFTARPGSGRGGDGSFVYLGSNARFWTGTESSSTTALPRYFNNWSGNVLNSAHDKRLGKSVRCIKD